MEKVYRRVTGKLARTLALDDQGLRYEIGTGQYNLAWTGVDHRIERTGRGGAVQTVILLTRDGKWIGLTGFENMSEIVETLRRRVPASGPRGLVERLLFHPWFGPACAVLALVGLLATFEAPPLQALLGGPILVALFVFAIRYANSRNPVAQTARQQGSSRAMQKFFIDLVVWIAVVLVTLFVLNFVVPRSR